MATQQFLKPNPAMEKGFERMRTGSFSPSAPASADRMTLNGAVGCTAVLLVILASTGLLGWLAPSTPLLIGATLVALGVAILTVFKPHLAPKTGFLYAAIEGYVLGALSAFFEASYPGIAATALGITVAITASLLLIYRTGLIKVTQNFRMAVAAATMGIMLFYVVGFVASFFTSGFPLIHSSSGWGILFSVFVVCIASANLVVDFDFVERGAEAGMPKYMEWYAAFSITVTLAWLYIEILRLVAKLRNQ